MALTSPAPASLPLTSPPPASRPPTARAAAPSITIPDAVRSAPATPQRSVAPAVAVRPARTASGEQAVVRRSVPAWLPLASRAVPLSAAIAVAAVGGLVGALLDKALGHDILVLFTVGLSLGAALGVLLVQRWHLFASVVAIPLVWFVLVVAGAVISPGDRLVYAVGIDFTLKAPAVLVATAVAVVLAVARRFAQPPR